MIGTMIILRPSDQIETKYYRKPPTVEELYTALGGGPEPIPWFNTIGVSVPDCTHATLMDCVAYCSTNRIQKKAHLNENATTAWEQSARRIGHDTDDNCLFGNVIILFGDREFMGCL